MSREGYTFSDETKLGKYNFQKKFCGEKRPRKKLEGHHKIPIAIAKELCKDTQEVRDYIRGKGNLIYLPHEEHILADEEAFNSIELIKEVIIYVLGSEVLK
jgi:hypothetical protein